MGGFKLHFLMPNSGSKSEEENTRHSLDHVPFWKAFDDFRYNQWVGLLSLSWSKLSFRIEFCTIRFRYMNHVFYSYTQRVHFKFPNGKTIPSCFSFTFDLTEPSCIILNNNNNNNKTTLLFSITNSHAFLSSNHYDLRLRSVALHPSFFFSFLFLKINIAKIHFYYI